MAAVVAVGLAVLVSIGVVAIAHPLLSAATVDGHTPRLSLLAWLGLTVTVLVSWAAAGTTAVWMVIDEPARAAGTPAGVPPLAHSGGDHHAVITAGSGIDWVLIGHAAIAVVLTVPLFRFGYFVASALFRARREGDARRSSLRMLGHRSTSAAGVIVVESETPTVYCMPGPPQVIVVTSAAKDALTVKQYDAVLAHEKSHLAGQHHVLVALADALSRTVPVPLFRSTGRFVRMLVEMRADDVAVRATDRRTVAHAMSKLSTLPPPSPALGASNGSVLARVLRICDPPTAPQRMVAGLRAFGCAGTSCVLQVTAIAVPAVTMFGGSCALLPL